MSKKFVIAEAYEPVEIDLWGKEFVSRDVTKDVEEKRTKLASELDVEQDGDKIVALVGKLVDLQVSSENGQKASTLIKQKWAASEVGIAALLDLLRALNPEEDEERPT